MRKYLWIGAISAAVLLYLSGCSNPEGGDGRDKEAAPVEIEAAASGYDPAWEQLFDETEISEAFREDLREFAFDSTAAASSKTDGNMVFSPLSLYYALSILGTGASGETEAEILEALGVRDKAELASQCGKLYRRYVYSQEQEKAIAGENGIEAQESAVRLANSLWISEKHVLNPKYQELCSEEFYASSYYVDFTDPETGKQIGKWISDQTEGALAPTMEIPSDTVLAILNTLYFYGGWLDRFDEGLTKEEPFYLQDGQEITVPFMNRTDLPGSFFRGDGYTLSSLAANNGCEMLFLLPDEGVDPAGLLDNGEALQEIFAASRDQWETGEIVWKIPKFSFGSSFDLEEMLKALGMERMFDSFLAEFADLSETPLYVNQAIQETHIGIDEDGVEGAAYTMILMEESGLWMPEDTNRVEMILDRPFLFAVHDRVNDVWLFLGMCADPSLS